MSSAAPADPGFPLVALRPVSDARHAWVAMALEAAPALDAAALARVFGALGLGASLAGMPCIAALGGRAADIATLAASPPPAPGIVLRLPWPVCADPGCEDGLQALHGAGFGLMADGLPPPEARLAGGVRALALPCTATNLPTEAHVWLARLPGPHLALGIDDAVGLDLARSAGFGWFLGNHALQTSASPRPPGPSEALLLKLLGLVVRDADNQELEALLRQDSQLSYQLLRLVNTVAFGRTQKIAGFGQALQLLGRRQLQRWLQLLLYAHGPGGINPLLPRAALRAGVMEELARRRGDAAEGQDQAFMAGMFSLLEILLRMPMAEVIAPLNLADGVAQALLARTGPVGALLRLVEAGEQGPGAALAAALATTGLPGEEWAGALAHASSWAIHVSRGG